MLATLLEARQSALADIAGACTGSAAFLRLLNDATRRIMRRGDFPGTVVPIHVCTRNGCVVWNRYVGHVRKMNVCSSPITIKNNWWQFANYDTTNPVGWWNRTCGLGGNGMFGTGLGEVTATGSLSETPVFQDIQGDNRTVRVYPLVQADIDREVTIFGIDNNNQVLRTKQPDGTWRDGIVIITANPFGSSNVFVRRIDRVLIEDGIQSTLRMYAYNADTNLLEDLAVYEPGETNPAYTKQTLRMPNCCTTTVTTGTCNGTVPITALVKLRFIPVRYDTDTVLIENLDMLKDYMQSLKFREQGDPVNANIYEQSAIREGNLDLWNRDQEDQIPVSLGDLMGTDIGRMQCF